VGFNSTLISMLLVTIAQAGISGLSGLPVNQPNVARL